MSAGTIITFYSYKGGVGRSFLLANVGVLLANWGYRVLCVDWDLEAPGLDRYFHAHLAGPPSTGLAELVASFAAGQSPDWRQHLSAVRLPGAADRLDLLAAGRADESFVARVQDLAWRELYAEHDLGLFLERVREQWQENYDFVCIDSRTGITDIGGICTVQMPDVLVLVFAANAQNVDGVANVYRRALAQRNRLPFDRPGLLALPVPSRFEPQVEYQLSKRWLDVFVERFGGLYANWANQEAAVPDLLNQTKVPYVPYWSYGEELAVLAEPRPSASDISYFITSLAALLAHRLADAREFLDNRDGYIASARRSGRGGPGITHDLYLSHAAEDGRYAAELAEALEEFGLTVLRADAAAGEDGGEGLVGLLRRCRHFVALLGPVVNETQELETARAVQQQVEQVVLEKQQPGRIVFVRLPTAPQRPLLRQFPRFKTVEADHADPYRVARDVAAALGHFAPQTEPDEDYY
jgi:MinD-like ATPase involved in chromosome partitioning or flagellar assembly